MKKLLIPGMLVAIIAFACSKKDSSSPSSTTTTGSTTSTTSTPPVMKASFTANKTIMDLGDTLRLTNTSQNFSISEWDWNGDGNPTTTKPSQIATHIFSKRGTFRVTLTVYDSSAKKSDTMSKVIIVGHKQLIGFTVYKASMSNPSNVFMSANPSIDQTDVHLTDTSTVASYPFTVKFHTPINLTPTTTTTWNVKILNNRGNVIESVPSAGPAVDLSKVFTSYIQLAPGSSTQDVRLNYTIVK